LARYDQQHKILLKADLGNCENVILEQANI